MTVTVSPVVEPSTGSDDPPRIRLNVTSTGESSTTITRLDPDGNTRPVRTLDGNALTLTGNAGLVYDYEAPFGAPVTYSSLESPATLSAPVTLAESQVWLIHPGVPSLSTPIELDADSWQEEEWAVTQTLHWVLGREFPVMQSDGMRKAPSTSITVSVDSLDRLASLRYVLTDAGTLLLNVPADMSVGVDTAYIAVGAARNLRPSNIGQDAHRRVVLPYQVVDRPAGGTQAQRTYVDVLVDNATYAVVMSKYPTYLELLAGP